jgi:molecular chaperone GrpE
MSEEEKQVSAELEKIRQLEEEIKEHKDKYLRMLAETENSRKRMQKEKQESTRYAMENLMAEILSPIDNFENALGFTDKMSQETKNWALGFQMILTQFKDLLVSNGVEPFTSVGEIFDPHKHQAVEMEETDEKPEGTIIHEFVKGYRCGERTIRPARVKVAKKPEAALQETKD